MITLKSLKSPARAKKYFRDQLARENSALCSARTTGVWAGNGCRLLALFGTVSDNDFAAVLCGKSPSTGDPLRARASANACLDVCYSAPKSVSVMGMFDRRIEPLVLQAVQRNLQEVSTTTRVRDRRGSQVSADVTRPSANIVTALFPHTSSRSDDPDLHVHAVLPNLCYDSAREDWLALDNRPFYQDQRFQDWSIHNDLAGGLLDLGYTITPSEHGFEIESVPPQIAARFSKRGKQVRSKVVELTDEEKRLASHRFRTANEAQRLELLSRLSAHDRKQLANLLTRDAKSNLSTVQLQSLFFSQLNSAERKQLDSVFVQAIRLSYPKGRVDQSKIDAKTAIPPAIDQAFKDSWLCPDTRLLTEMLRANLGRITLSDARAALIKAPQLQLAHDGRNLIQRETGADLDRLFAFCKRPDKKSTSPAPLHLSVPNEATPAARRSLLSLSRTTEAVIAMRAGDPAVLDEITRGCGTYEGTIVVCPPSGPKVRRQDWTTPDSQLGLREIPRDGLVVVQSADTYHPEQLVPLFAAADRANARIVLLDQGEKRANDHNLVRYLERYAGIDVISNPPGSLASRRALQETSRSIDLGDVGQAFASVRSRAGLHQMPSPDGRHQAIADEYAASLACGRSAIVVTATDAEASAITSSIRSLLKRGVPIRGVPRPAGVDRQIATLTPVNIDLEKRKQVSNYRAGMVIEYIQNAPGVRKGTQFDVVAVDDNTVLVERAGEREPLVIDQAEKFSLLETHLVAMAVGDRVIATQSRMAHRGGRLTRAHFYEVTAISPQGAIELDLHITFPAGKAHLSLGYATAVAPGEVIPVVDDLFISSSPIAMRKLGGWSALNSLMKSARETVSVYSDDIEAFESAIAATVPVQLQELSPESGQSALDEALPTNPPEQIKVPELKPAQQAKSRRPIPVPNSEANLDAPTV